jgi:hypothetical protein
LVAFTEINNKIKNAQINKFQDLLSEKNVRCIRASTGAVPQSQLQATSPEAGDSSPSCCGNFSVSFVMHVI